MRGRRRKEKEKERKGEKRGRRRKGKDVICRNDKYIFFILLTYHFLLCCMAQKNGNIQPLKGEKKNDV